jgi:hypothetical protein
MIGPGTGVRAQGSGHWGPGTGVRVYLAARHGRSDQWREMVRRD